MRQVTVNAARWSQDSEGAWLCLRVKSPEAAMEVCDALKPGKEYTATSKLKGCVNVTVWYGSSVYDTEQMARLIDAIVQDCRDVGIETMTPRELDALVSRWGEVSV